MSTIPEKLINFRVYEDGNELIGTADITLPTLEAMSETVKGAGIAGEIDSPTIGHYKIMEVTLNWRTLLKHNIQLASPDGKHLDMRGSQQMYDPKTGKYSTLRVKCVVNCVPKKAELGKLEAAASVGNSNTFEIYYIKLTIGNDDVMEIDKYNYIAKFGNDDSLLSVREDLGLV